METHDQPSTNGTAAVSAAALHVPAPAASEAVTQGSGRSATPNGTGPGI